jgi:hypothetical protein
MERPGELIIPTLPPLDHNQERVKRSHCCVAVEHSYSNFREFSRVRVAMTPQTRQQGRFTTFAAPKAAPQN